MCLHRCRRQHLCRRTRCWHLWRSGERCSRGWTALTRKGIDAVGWHAPYDAALYLIASSRCVKFYRFVHAPRRRVAGFYAPCRHCACLQNPSVLSALVHVSNHWWGGCLAPDSNTQMLPQRCRVSQAVPLACHTAAVILCGRMGQFSSHGARRPCRTAYALHLHPTSTPSL